MRWDGRERRKVNSDDHDLLTKIDANLVNHIRKMEEHIVSDEVRFTRIDVSQKWLQRFVWLAAGGGVVVAFVIKLFLK